MVVAHHSGEKSYNWAYIQTSCAVERLINIFKEPIQVSGSQWCDHRSDAERSQLNIKRLG